VVVITKGFSRYELPGDLDGPLQAIIAYATGCGYRIDTGEAASKEAPAPVTFTKGNKSMSKRKQIVEFAKSYTGGEVPVAKANVLHALEATAAKRGMSLSKFAETPEGSAMYQLYKNAPGNDVPPRPVFKTSYEALLWEAAEHRRKANIPSEGFRDEPNPQF